MPWVRLDDQFTDNPKVVAAGPLAGWLYVSSLVYSARNLTDGFIPVGMVMRLADFSSEMFTGTTGYVSENHSGFSELVGGLVHSLVTHGLWETKTSNAVSNKVVTPFVTGYVIHDYHHYQPSREQVLKERDANRKRQEVYRKTRDGESTINSNAVSHAVSNGEVTAMSQPPRTRTRTVLKDLTHVKSLAPPKKARHLFDDQDSGRLHEQFDSVFGAEGTTNKISAALNHSASDKWKDQYIGVRDWLLRDAEKLGKMTIGKVSQNGKSSAAHSLTAISAEQSELSKQASVYLRGRRLAANNEGQAGPS